ncbi:MAG: type IV pilus twitching motility protein PilT [Clostridiales bacterium]|nr:type IV pilus twitching motility protein PilT [Clostridiales bacterium]
MIAEYEAIFKQAIEKKASDIHIVVGVPYILRVNGSLVKLGREVEKDDVLEYINRMLNDEQKQELMRVGDIDLAVELEDVGRFRINIYKQKGTYAIAARTIGDSVMTVEELGLPNAIVNLANLQKGMVLVTGPTGSGKSTTLASLIDLMNTTKDLHILTLEDPIEYVHKHKKSIVTQREIGRDSIEYKTALRAALREDPDVILIGEMRDADSIQIAITAAETGHLVFSTLHTIGAAKTIDRVIDVFRAEQQQQIRTQLASVLQAVISQQLIPRLDGNGRVMATEIMLVNPAIANLIRDSKTYQIDTQIQIGRKLGMQSMDNALFELYQKKLISQENALAYSQDQENFSKTYLKNISYGGSQFY